jgi:hypothetical protein
MSGPQGLAGRSHVPTAVSGIEEKPPRQLVHGHGNFTIFAASKTPSMKSFLLFLALSAGLSLHAQPAATAEYASYGDAITADGALSVAQFQDALSDKDSLSTKLRTEIQQSCAKKGCWMDVKLADGSSMKVRFRDYAFFVPTKGLEGKEVVMEGRAKKEVTSVAMLRHYAEDAGKSKEEIAAITEPETSWTFEADGVLIRK